MPSWLSPQCLCGTYCIWASDLQFHIAGTNESKSAEQAKQKEYHKFLSVIRETQSAQFSQNQDRCNMYVIKETMCPPLPPIIITMALFGHAMYSYIHIAGTNEPKSAHSLVHWYQQCVTVMTIYDICIYMYVYTYMCIYGICIYIYVYICVCIYML